MDKLENIWLHVLMAHGSSSNNYESNEPENFLLNNFERHACRKFVRRISLSWKAQRAARIKYLFHLCSTENNPICELGEVVRSIITLGSQVECFHALMAFETSKGLHFSQFPKSHFSRQCLNHLLALPDLECEDVVLSNMDRFRWAAYSSCLIRQTLFLEHLTNEKKVP